MVMVWLASVPKITAKHFSSSFGLMGSLPQGLTMGVDFLSQKHCRCTNVPPPSQVPRTCEERWSYEQPPHGHTPQCSQQVCSRTGFPRGEGCFQTVSSAGSLGSPRKAPRLSGERHAVGQGAAPPCTWLHWTRTDGKKRAFISHLANAFLLSPTPVAFSLFGLRLTTRNVFYALPNAHIPVCMWD